MSGLWSEVRKTSCLGSPGNSEHLSMTNMGYQQEFTPNHIRNFSGAFCPVHFGQFGMGLGPSQGLQLGAPHAMLRLITSELADASGTSGRSAGHAPPPPAQPPRSAGHERNAMRISVQRRLQSIASIVTSTATVLPRPTPGSVTARALQDPRLVWTVQNGGCTRRGCRWARVAVGVAVERGHFCASRFLFERTRDLRARFTFCGAAAATAPAHSARAQRRQPATCPTRRPPRRREHSPRPSSPHARSAPVRIPVPCNCASTSLAVCSHDGASRCVV